MKSLYEEPMLVSRECSCFSIRSCNLSPNTTPVTGESTPEPHVLMSGAASGQEMSRRLYDAHHPSAGRRCRVS
jgi:hypothetical protein